ncbi:MAG: leucine-rich repeat domain-containing protein [Firmicutes bacterium]|nr:leucine-rich repeat domain-containing protein [Bacillota bacterium]
MEITSTRSTIPQPVTGGNIYFDRASGYITDCDKSVTEARIPEEIAGKPVTGIKGYIFRFCDNLKKVTVPKSMTDLGGWSFWGRNSIKNIYVSGENEKFCDIDGVLFSKDAKTLIFYPPAHGDSYEIPEGTVDLAKGAFKDCTSLVSVKIPNTVKNIYGSFHGCTSLTNVKLPSSLEYIGDGAFGNCKAITGISIPFSVRKIVGNAFSGCENLKAIRVNSDNVYYCDVDGVLYNREKTRLVIYPADHGMMYQVPEMVSTIGEWAFAKSHKLSILILSNSVREIEEYAFGDCDSITNLSIPDSVTSIGKRAFWHCASMERVTLSHNIETVDDYTFDSCVSLKGITIPEGVKNIGEGAFSHCYELKDIILPDTLTTVGTSAFESCENVSAVTIPNSVKNMGKNAFKGCWKLYTVYCPRNSVADDIDLYPKDPSPDFIYTGEDDNQNGKDIVAFPVQGGNAYFRKSTASFVDCDMYVTQANLPDTVESITVESIGEGAFLNCSALTNLVLPRTIKSIGPGAFSGCTALKSVNIPQGVKTLGKRAFDFCPDLQEVTIPATLERIEGYAFGGCRSLKRITVDPENAYYTDEDGILYTRDRSVIVCYPAGREDRSYNIEPTVKSIYENAFDEARNLEDINFPYKLVSIGEGAFTKCNALRKIIIPEGTKSIGNFAFKDCRELTEVDIPNTVKSFEDFVFEGCENLSVVYCSQGSFADNKNLYPGDNVTCVYIH